MKPYNLLIELFLSDRVYEHLLDNLFIFLIGYISIKCPRSPTYASLKDLEGEKAH